MVETGAEQSPTPGDQKQRKAPSKYTIFGAFLLLDAAYFVWSFQQRIWKEGFYISHTTSTVIFANSVLLYLYLKTLNPKGAGRFIRYVLFVVSSILISDFIYTTIFSLLAIGLLYVPYSIRGSSVILVLFNPIFALLFRVIITYCLLSVAVPNLNGWIEMIVGAFIRKIKKGAPLP